MGDKSVELRKRKLLPKYSAEDFFEDVKRLIMIL